MTDQPTHPQRRVSDRHRTDSPRVRQNRLVRHIAADPVLIQWLAVSKSRTLHEAAAALASEGFSDAAELVRKRADRLASGEASAF